MRCAFTFPDLQILKNKYDPRNYAKAHEIKTESADYTARQSRNRAISWCLRGSGTNHYTEGVR